MADVDWSAETESQTFKASMATGYNYFQKFKKYAKSAQTDEAKECWSNFLLELPELCRRSKVYFSIYFFFANKIIILENCSCSAHVLFGSQPWQRRGKLCFRIR